MTTLLCLTSASRKLVRYCSLDQILRMLIIVGLECAVVAIFANNYRPTGTSAINTPSTAVADHPWRKGQSAINVRSAVAVAAVFWSVAVFWPFVTGVALLGTKQGVDALYTVRQKVLKIRPPSRGDRDVEASSADVSRDVSRDVSSIELGPLTPR